MPSEYIGFRLDEETLKMVSQYQTDHRLKRTEAIKAILNEYFASLKTQTITSDVPMGESIDPEKQKAIHELHQEAITPLPPPPCQFCGKGYIEPKLNIQMVYCDNKARKPKGKGEAVPVPLTICQKCWERREYIKTKKDREQEENPTPQNDFPALPECKNISRQTTNLKNKAGKPFIYCSQYGEWKTPEFCWQCFESKK